MATGGETTSIYSCCSPCSDDERNTVARHYCVDCEMYFCTKCLKCHNKIPASKAHQVNDVSSDLTDADDDLFTSGRGSDSFQRSTCTLHRGKLIDTFCMDHNEVCCGACALVKHRSCTTVSIDIAAKDFNASHERDACREALEETIAKFNEEKDKRVENLECIGKEKLELIEDVDKYEEKIIAKVKELANISRNEIRSKYEEHKTALDNDIETFDVVLTTTNRHVDQLEQSHNEQLFITIKSNNTMLKDWEILLQDMTPEWRKREIRFCFDMSLDNHVLNMKSFGGLEEDFTVEEYTATFRTNVDIKQGGGHRNHSYVYDMCLMESGDLLVTDDKHMKLKRFNSDLLNLKDAIILSGQPVAVCKIDDNEVAVRIRSDKLVQFVSVGQSMQLTSSFELDEDGWGLAYDADTRELLACEEKKVSVYSKTGNKLRTYDHDTNGEQIFSACRQIALSENKQDIYVTDRNKGLVVLDRNGTLKTKVALSGAWPLCLLPGDICLVGQQESGVIVQFDKDGKQVGNLIGTKEGRNFTYCAMYDRKHSRLIVGGSKSLMSVYTLSAN